MRKLLTSIKKRFNRYLMPRYRVVHRYDSRLLVDSHNWIDARVIARAPYENEQLAVCQQIIRDRRIDTFIDVGANFGLYSVVLNSTTPLKQTYAFEPVTRNFHQLCGNLFVNQLGQRVTPLQLAASDVEGEAEIHVDPESTGVSRLSLEDSGRDNQVYRHSETIRMVRVDEQLSLAGERIFIKIDVEGHEMAALRGMTGLLQKNQVCLQVEASGDDRLAELDAFFSALGYRFEGAIGIDRRYSNFAD